jgi:hypothetical protein
MAIVFKKAEKSKSKLRLALSGPAGAGKTYSALRLAMGLLPPGGRIAMLDTENGSAQLYSKEFDFDVFELGPPYHPNNFIEAILAAEQAGYDLLIMDSITHEWKGQGGVLDLHTQATKTIAKGNSFNAWSIASPLHQAFIDAIVRSKIHIICTMRSKTAYAQGEENGRKFVRKMGLSPEQRDGIEFEFTTVMDISPDGHYAISSKDRTGLFGTETPFLITEETGKLIRDWLESGRDPEPQAWRPSPAFQMKVTQWIDNASKRMAFDAAIAAVDANFLDPNESSYMKEQLELAKKMLVNDISQEFIPDFDMNTGEVIQ